MTRGSRSAAWVLAGAAGLALTAIALRGGGADVAAVAPLPRTGSVVEADPEPTAPSPVLAGPPSSLPERKLTAREVAVLVTSLQEPPVRDQPQAREKVLRTLEANRPLAVDALRRVKVAALSAPAQASIRDALRRLGE